MNVADSPDHRHNWNTELWPGLVFVGERATKLYYNLAAPRPGTWGTWTLESKPDNFGYNFDVHATAYIQNTYGRGKWLWNITMRDLCPRWEQTSLSENKLDMIWQAETYLKFTGCRDGDFTCNDGKCIKMEQRCDQVEQCTDQTDEEDCVLLTKNANYKKLVPPITTISSTNFTVVPVPVNISIELLQVVEIEEVDHSIHLQFQIILEWRENRVTYLNLKEDTALNALTDQEINGLWLPLVIYVNTDQKETTRLGEASEWMTRVTVTKEGQFVRSSLEDVDEIEEFAGSENRLMMNQTYTHEFNCKYKLRRYPFDTQVVES